MEREEIQKRLKKELDKNRYEHTLGVMYTAGSLAMAYGYDYEKAMIAGLLHDCAKCLPTEKKISLCEKNDILISKVERENPGLLHAKAGMVLAEEAYGVKDRSRPSVPAASTIWIMTLVLSICRRNSCPRPTPSEAPSISPGISAITKPFPSSMSTTPRFGCNVVKW